MIKICYYRDKVKIGYFVVFLTRNLRVLVTYAYSIISIGFNLLLRKFCEEQNFQTI